MIFKSLTLYTSDLDKVFTFYHGKLGFRTVEKGDGFIAFQVGSSILRFELRDEVNPYHVAFNIPSFQEQDALVWLKDRVKILPYDGMEIIDFKNWNAKAIYFYDEENNILEFIARRNLNAPSSLIFEGESILCVSEIGVPVENIEQAYEWLNSQFSIPIFDGNFDRFCALGSDQGLFILIDVIKKKWFPVDDLAFSSDFIVELEVDNNLMAIFFKDGKFGMHEN